jgi:hypothetical protein
MSQSDAIQCATHGQATATYICGHLFSNSKQHWISDFPSEDEPWPDAWCERCDVEYLKKDEWNETNQSCLQLRLICAHCYEQRLGDSIDSLSADTQAAWIEAVTAGHDTLHAKHEHLEREYRLGKHERFDYDQASNQLVFSNAGKPAVIADIEIIGSVSKVSQTWLWSWSNFHMLPNVRTRIRAVRDYGIEHGFSRLTVAKWPADEVDGWEVSGIAAQVLDAQGVYRVPSQNTFMFMAMMSLRHAP